MRLWGRVVSGSLLVIAAVFASAGAAEPEAQAAFLAAAAISVAVALVGVPRIVRLFMSITGDEGVVENGLRADRLAARAEVDGSLDVLMNVTNRKEIAVFGIKRSGNHAVIFWLLHHLGRHTVHLNDVTSESPYDSCTEINVKGLPVRRCKPDIRYLYRHASRGQGVIEYSKKDKAVDWNFLRHFTPKDCLIVSYENRILEDEAYAGFVQSHDFQVGCSEKRYRIVILRDAFNLFASLCRAPFVTAEDIATCVEIYKQYAELFLSADRQKELNVICANYNEWFLSSDYRIELARQLGVTLDGGPFQGVPSVGGGSSFDGTSMDGRGQEMKVLERWKVCRDDPTYRAIFKDSRLVELSEAIFGRIVPAAW